MMTDLAQQVGGDKVKVTCILPEGSDPHTFSPKPAHIKQLKSAQLVLASGKGMENYLEKLKGNLSESQKLVEVGRDIKSIKIDAKDAAFMCCPEHAHGAVDPHWWNGLDNMSRAAGNLAELFAEADPANKDSYKANAKAYQKKLAALKKWAKDQASTIPQENRKIATSHLAMLYFAKEFGFKLIPVQGLSPEVKATSQDIQSAIKIIQENKVKAIFPEQGVPKKQIEEITKSTGAAMGGELITDGNGTGKLATFEAAFMHNVSVLVAALK